MESEDRKGARSERGLDYIDVEVLPPEAKTKQADDLDPFIKLVSRLLDTIFVIPGTRIRFGIEPIIGLIPVLGDQVTSLISAGLLYRSVQHRLPKDRSDPNGTEHLHQRNRWDGAILWGSICPLVQTEYPELQDPGTICRTNECRNIGRLAVCFDFDRLDLLPDSGRDPAVNLRDRKPISVVVNYRGAAGR